MKRSTKEEQRFMRAATAAAQVIRPNNPQELELQKLQDVFGSLANALEAGAGEMQRLSGLSRQIAYIYSFMPDLARYMLHERAVKIRTIRSMEDARQHLLPLYLGMHYECGYILCLNSRGELLSTQMLRMGSVDEAPFYLRIIINAALHSGGELFILAHNHPGGTLQPSLADIESTARVLEVMHGLGMTLLDHVIIADRQAVSMRRSRACGRLPWQRCAPLPEQLRCWPAAPSCEN